MSHDIDMQSGGGREGVRDLILGITEELKRPMSMVGCHTSSAAHQGILIRD